MQIDLIEPCVSANMSGSQYPSPAIQRKKALEWKDTVLLGGKIIKKNKGTKSTQQQRKDALEYAERHFANIYLPPKSSTTTSSTTSSYYTTSDDHRTFERFEDFCRNNNNDDYCCKTCKEAENIMHHVKPTVAMAAPVNDCCEVFEFSSTFKIKPLANGKVPNFEVTLKGGCCCSCDKKE